MQAIVTKFLGATNCRGSRVKATAQAGSVTLDWDHALDIDENHRAAAVALANKYGWLDHSDLSEGGGLPGGSGNCYTLSRKRSLDGATWTTSQRTIYRDGVALVDISRTGDTNFNVSPTETDRLCDTIVAALNKVGAQ